MRPRQALLLKKRVFQAYGMILVMGGAAGFVGANFVLDWLAQADDAVINIDVLTCAGNRENLAALAEGDELHLFVQDGDNSDSTLFAMDQQTKLLAKAEHFA